MGTVKGEIATCTQLALKHPYTAESFTVPDGVATLSTLPFHLTEEETETWRH